jgi:DNA modification methylase
MSDFAIYNEDCITGMAARLEPESVHLCVTSIPFGALFSYSGKTEDIGNNQDGIDMRAGQFGLHMRFFCEQLFRVMRPGCNVCIHIQQLLAYLNQHGFMGRRDFRAAVTDLFSAAGFNWVGEVAIPKNPQIIAKRLNLHCLMFETGRNNARKLAPAVNDYIMVYQKPGDAETPVRALQDKDKNPDGWVSTDEWIRWARGVWDDILEIDVLEGWKSAKEEDDEKHVCPLQLTPILRCVRLYTNPGELVLDPFMGIGSTAHVCLGGQTIRGETVEAPRRVVGFEIKESYHRQGLRNARTAARVARDRDADLVSMMEAE